MHWTRHGQWRRPFGLAAAAAALVGGLVTGVAVGPASANADSTIGFGPCYLLHSVCIPRGTFSIETDSVGGSGNRIDYVSADFTYVGQISNLWIDHDFYDVHGNLVPGGHLQGPEKYGHFTVGGQSWSWGSSWFTVPKYGFHCATLFSQLPDGSIKEWARACQQIS